MGTATLIPTAEYLPEPDEPVFTSPPVTRQGWSFGADGTGTAGNVLQTQDGRVVLTIEDVFVDSQD